MGVIRIGRVTNFLSKIGVAVIELESGLSAGDKIVLKGGQRAFEQVVDSMQINNQNVDNAAKGELVGVKVRQKVKQNDIVYKIQIL